MEIISATKKYFINIYDDLAFLDEIASTPNAFFVIDENIVSLYEKTPLKKILIKRDNIYTIKAVEENKTIGTALNLCEMMTKLSSKRNTTLVSIGGGIVQDITGFVANILYRGISWLFVPTTLLSSCDSCIGGKTSLNYKNYKNLLGTFYSPDKIFICPLFFRTLSENDFQSGLGEVVKFNIMYGVKGISKIEADIDSLLQRNSNVIAEYVESSLIFKKHFIEEDEFDKGERVKLNFAHTFGHAIESVTNYGIPHGTAVAMGTIVADYIAAKRSWLNLDTFNRINLLIKKIINPDYLKYEMEINSIIAAIRKDKKQINTGIRAVLMNENTELIIVNDVTENEIHDGFVFMSNFLSKDS